MFDQNYNVMDMGWKAVPATANFNKQRVYFDPLQIKEAGYIYTYLSYEGESTQYVYFDDFKITHTKTPVLQYSDYYAFGLQNGNSWTRENNKNNFLYNEGSEFNTASGFYDLPFRNYDAALGRFFQVDQLASSDHSFSSYSYARNNPVMMNDPSGLMVPAPPPQSSTWSEGQLRGYYYTHGGGEYGGTFQSWATDNGFDVGGPTGGGNNNDKGNRWAPVINAIKNGASVEDLDMLLKQIMAYFIILIKVFRMILQEGELRIGIWQCHLTSIRRLIFLEILLGTSKFFSHQIVWMCLERLLPIEGMGMKEPYMNIP